MRALLASSLALTLWAPAALAQALDRLLPPQARTCWERVYDAVHLIAHPAQKVTALRLVTAPYAYGAPRERVLAVTLSFNLRERRKGADPGDYDYSISGLCRPAGKAMRCETEYDAGSWRLEAGPSGRLDVRNGNIIANPSEHDAEEIADNAVRIPARPDDGIWRLESVACSAGD
jgi:hypothetical protein